MVKAHDIITKEDLGKILSAIEKPKVKAFKINTMIQFLWDCGARVSEVTNLKVSDLDLDERLVTFRNTKNKEDRKNKITPEMASKLKKLVKNCQNGDSVFKMSRVAAWQTIKLRVDRSGIDKKVATHTFRHNFITRKLDAGVVLFRVQKWVGHKSAESTAQYYHHTTNDLEDVLEA